MVDTDTESVESESRLSISEVSESAALANGSALSAFDEEANEDEEEEHGYFLIVRTFL